MEEAGYDQRRGSRRAAQKPLPQSAPAHDPHDERVEAHGGDETRTVRLEEDRRPHVEDHVPQHAREEEEREQEEGRPPVREPPHEAGQQHRPGDPAEVDDCVLPLREEGGRVAR